MKTLRELEEQLTDTRLAVWFRRWSAMWEWAQSLFDIDGDLWMGAFTLIVLWKILHGGLGEWDAAAYASAVAAFAYSNK